MNDLFFLLTFLILSTAFAVASVIAGFVVGYKSEDVDDKPYECGMKIFGTNKVQFDIKFLNFAILFLIFDVQSIFLFPLAVNVGEVEAYVLGEAVLFTLIMLFTLFFAIKKNILRWQ